MKYFAKRIVSSVLALAMVLSLIPQFLTMPTKAANDAPTFGSTTAGDGFNIWNGKPESFQGKASVRLYYKGDTFPGEPRYMSDSTYSSNYITYNNAFEKGGSGYFKVNEILKDTVPGSDEFVLGSNLSFIIVWSATSGIFDPTGVDEYFTDEFKQALNIYGQQMITDVLEAKQLDGQVVSNTNPENYEIVWYVVKYQRIGETWYINGLIREKDKYSVTYDGNGNDAGSAPDGQVNMTYSEAQNYFVNDYTSTDEEGEDTSLSRSGYTFAGWNTKSDGSGTFFEAKKYADLTKVTDDEGKPVTAITLYAQWSKNRSIRWYDGYGNIIHLDTNLSRNTKVTYDGVIPTKAPSTQTEYVFDGWSDSANGSKKYDMHPTVTIGNSDLNLYAHFAEQDRTYTVTWVNNTVLETDSGIVYGDTATYNGATPTRSSTVNKAFTFDGWATEEGGTKAYEPGTSIPVTSDMTLYAVFSETDIHTVTWYNEAGTVTLADEPVLSGSSTALTQTAPAKEGYTFDGWATSPNGPKVHDGNATVTVNGNLNLYAHYTKNIYTITWKNGDATLGTTTVEHGETPVYGGATPTKEATTETVYTFAGWTPAITSAVGNATYTAQFTDAPRPYTVIWKNWDGAVLKTEQVDYGSTPSYEGTPTRANTSTHTYTFKAWDPSVSPVTGDVTYTATYTETAKIFTATVKVWKDPTIAGDGSIDAEHSTPADIGSPLTTYDTIYLRNLNTETATALTRTAEGTYTADLTYGTYAVVIRNGSDYTELTKERIILPADNTAEDPDTTTADILFFSVTYHADGGTILGNGTKTEYYQRGTHVQVIGDTPVRAGYAFAGWKLDDTDRILTIDQALTDISVGLIKPHTLTAQWIPSQDRVVVNVTIYHHDSAKQGINPEYQSGTLNINLTHREKVTVGTPGDYYEKVGFSTRTDNWYSSENTVTNGNECTTTLTGIYSAEGLPSNWEYSANVTMEDYWRVEGPQIAKTEDGYGNTVYTITVTLQYNPDLFNLGYTVKIDPNMPDQMVPTAVDLKILSYKNDGWSPISRHVNTTIDETFTSADRTETSSYPVPVHKTNDTNYYYRVAVAGFTLPDGTELSASGGLVNYSSEGITATYSYADGAYTAVVSLTDGQSNIGGADAVYGTKTITTGDGDPVVTASQIGTITITVYARPKTVTFDPNGGTLNGQTTSTNVENQFRIPVLANYRPEPPSAKHVFLGWYLAGNMTEAVTGTAIDSDVTLTARWKDPLTVSGQVDITLPSTVSTDDRPTSVRLSLVRTSPTGVVEVTQVKDIAVAPSAWSGNIASVNYSFDPVIQTGTYRVHVTAPDYTVTYRNDAAGEYSTDGNLVDDANSDDAAAVNIRMLFVPTPFSLKWDVFFGEAGSALLPLELGIQVNYANEANESVDPEQWPQFALQNGEKYTQLTQGNSPTTDSFAVWQNHPQGYPYDYALEVVKWKDKDGTEHTFDETSPFTLTYAPRIAWYENGNQVITGKIPSNLGITVTPKTYTITYNLNSGADSVTGLDGAPQNHTWSKQTTGIPTNLTRTGWKFLGWDCNVDAAYADGTVRADTAQDIVLTAKWQPQKPITFRVVNGIFTDKGNSDPILIYAELGSDIKARIPAVSANSYHEGGSWNDPALSGDTVVVTGTDAVTYTYTFQRQNTTVSYNSYVTNDYLPHAASLTLLRGDYIRVNPNGGTWNAASGIQDVRMTDDDGTLELSDPTRNQYIFAGWNAESINDTTTHPDGTVSTLFTAVWLQDSEPCDGVPDMYQKKLTFRVENGHWKDGTDAEKVIYVDLKDGNGKYSTVGTAQIPDATISAISSVTPKAGFIADGAFWSPSLPAGHVVSGTESRIYTFRHYIKITFADAAQNMAEDEIHLLPGTVVTVDPNGGTLNGGSEPLTVAVTGSGHLTPPDNPNHTFKGWKLGAGTAPVSHIFTAQWELVTYEIVWKDADGTVLETDAAVPYGTLPTYDGETPTKTADDQYTYTFSGWTPTVVTADGDAEYTAVYSNTVNEYTVTWKNENTVLETDLVPYGGRPVYVGSTPAKVADAQYTYAHDGWQKDGAGEVYTADSIPTVTGDVIYTAHFSNTVNKYTVTWQKEDGSQISSEQVDYNGAPQAPAAPVKESDDQYTYAFAGWKNSTTSTVYAADKIPAVIGNVTYQATYTSNQRSYTIQWQKEDGTEISSVTLDYGTYPVAPAAPKKENTAQYTYTFKGWTNAGGTTYLTGNIPMVTGNASYQATYTETLNSYTVTWLNYNDTVMETDEHVPYGTFPSFDDTSKLTTDDGNYHYTFRGWWVDSNGDGVQDAGEPFYPKDTALPTIESHVTYRAVYDTTPKARTVTVNVWLNATQNDDGSFSGDRADIDTVTNGQRANLYLVPNGSEADPAKYTKALWNGTEKIYTVSLLPGEYLIYAGDTAETAEREATQIVDVVNTNVTVNTLYNSVTYKDGTTATGGNVITTEYYKSGSGPIYVPTTVPTLSGKVFTHWHDKDDNVFNASTAAVTITLTDSITRGYVLTAHWAEAKDITVVVNIDPKDGSVDPSIADKTLNIQLASSATLNGTYIGIHDTNKPAAYSTWTHNADGTHSYSYTYENRRGDHFYQATALLAGYERTGDIDVSSDGKTVTINLKYDPDGFDLNFAVEMNATGLNPTLVPKSVDVQIVFFERTDKNGNGSWKTLSNTQNKPIEVALSRVGDSDIWRGTGTYHVWSKYTSGNAAGELYLYRIAVNDFDLGPNRGALTTTSTGENEFKVYSSVAGTYHPVGAYTASVTVVDQVNNCPNGTAGGLLGSHDSNGSQHGTITATITAIPYNVVLNHNNTTGNTTTVSNRFLIPDLTSYGMPTYDDHTFAGWWTKDGSANGDWGTQVSAKDTVIKDLIPDAPAGSTLNLYARWNKDLTVTGNVTVSNLYQGDIIYPKDRPASITVELRNAATNAVLSSQAVSLTDLGDTDEEKAAAAFRTGTYTFADIPDNGTAYRIYVAVPNFDQKYRNETVAADAAFSESLYAVVDQNGDDKAEVDVSLAFDPHTFDLEYTVDATEVGEGFRPTAAGIVIRSGLGTENPQNWNIIAQQKQGDMVEAHEIGINANGTAQEDAHSNGIWHKFPVWRRSSSGSLYEYAIQLWTLTHNGHPYTQDDIETAPFTVTYAPSRAWYNGKDGQESTGTRLTSPDPDNPHGLVAYLIPKSYTVTYELGQSGTVTGTGITTVDGNTAQGTFRWSYGISEEDLPTAAAAGGAIFDGWYTKDDGGNWGADEVTSIDADTMENITLYARWKYDVTWKNGSETITDKVLEGTKPIYSGTEPTKEATAQYTYTFSGWQHDGVGTVYTAETLPAVTGNVTYVASFSNTTNKYTVTWVDEDGTTELEKDTDVPYGTMPSYDGDTPTKVATAQHTYTFKGWEPVVSAVTGNVTYKATYNDTVNKYTVTWKNENGTTLRTESVEYGAKPVYSGANPTKAATAQYTYTFKGWEPAIADDTIVTGDVTYTATYSQTVNEYTIAWVDGNGNSLKTDTLAYGTTPSYTGATPTKTETAQYTYQFINQWSPEVKPVTGNATYTALFLSIVRTYPVTWENEDGTVLETDTGVPYGTTPRYDGATPTKAADDQYTYTFDGWTPAVGAITGETVYTATYSGTVNQYTVTWVDGNGTTLKSEQVAYGATPSYSGATPTKTATAQHTYTFNGGWSPAIEMVTGNATYIAQFESTVNTYTVIWVDENGTTELEKDENVPYGTTPSFDRDGGTDKLAQDKCTGQYNVTFNAWTPATSNVTGNVTYTATYTRTVNKYTVKWVDENGNELLSRELEYGTTPVYIAAEPTKTGDAQYSYTFTGWWVDSNGNDAVDDGETYAKGVTLPNVSAHVIYKATFEQSINSYTVTWKNENGTVLETDTNVAYGTVPTYGGATPTKTADAQYTYTHDSWTPAISEVTGDVTYTATYTATKQTYTIKWVDENGTTVLDKQTLEYGASPVYAGSPPTKTATAEFTYTFKEWTPAVATVTGDATYTATYHANVNKYTVIWKDGDTVLETDTNVPYGTTPTYNNGGGEMESLAQAKTTASDGKYTYTFKGWSPSISDVTADVTYSAVYNQTLNSYTVMWKNGDTVLETDENVPYGATPKYDGSLPTKEATAQYTYTWSGWTPVISTVTGNVTYTAKFDSTVNQYDVVWKNEDGTILKSDYKVPYGTIPTAPADPSKASTAEFTYTFAGWDNEIVAVVENATYTATYTSMKNTYTVKWMVNGELKETDTVEYGKKPEYNGEPPTKASTTEHTFTFAGWSPAIANDTIVTGDVTYTAVFIDTVNKYTIIWKNGDAELEKDENVPYGSIPTYDGETPFKTGDAQYSYKHVGWTPAVVPVEGEKTYTAVFETVVNKYLITWMDGNGNTLKTEQVEYGTVPTAPANPTKAADAQYSYTFSEWDSTPVAVTGPATYTAQFDSTVNTYTITWRNDDGSVIDTTTVEYGEIPAHAAPGKVSTPRYSFTFAGWKDESDRLYAGELPEVTGTASYTAAYDATERTYTITWKDDDDTTIDTTQVKFGDMPTHAHPTKATTAQYTYTFNKWLPALASVTGDATYTASYSESVNKYTVTWKNEGVDTPLETDENVPYGDTPEYNGSTPTKAATNKYTYTFKGWDKVISAVTGDVTYTAQYTETPRMYTVTWKNYDGTVLETKKVTYNASVPTYDGVSPKKDSTERYSYAYAGWEPAITAETKITADTVFTAAFTQSTRKYTITWVNDDGSSLGTAEVEYGTTPSRANPTKQATAEYTYTFTGWTPALTEVTGNATYKATYSAAKNSYTITWQNDDGSQIDTSTVEYGVLPTHADPTKPATDEYTYIFAGWTPAVVSVTGEATYQATFTAEKNKHLITWVDGNGNVLKTEQVEYGTVPTAPANPTKTATDQYIYTFTEWDSTPAAVTGPTTYTAQFRSTVKEYTITWKDDNGSVIDTTTVLYGETPTHTDPTKAETVRYQYTFREWTPAVMSVTGDATYTATYSSTARTYTITWLNDDDSLIGTTQVEYDAIPSFGDAVKATTAEYTYTFTGWTPAVVSVTGPATYKATFTQTKNKYSVTWKNEDGTVLETDEFVEYGTMPNYDGETPTKAATAEYTYTFDAWSPNLTSVTGNAEYTATYTATKNKYTITWLDESGVLIDTTQVEYGTVPTHADPSKDSDAQYSYTFSGWVPAPVAVTGDAAYTASFAPDTNKYTITYTDGVGGSEIFADDVHSDVPYGSATPAFRGTPSRPGYIFAGWSPAVLNTVTGNATYAAQWDIFIPAPTTGTVVLTKVDSVDTSKALAKVVFDLYRANGTKVGTCTTDANGKITRTLTPGDYYWLETRPAEGYVMDNTKQYFTVRAGQTNRMTVTNTHAQVPSQFSSEHYAFVLGSDDGLVHPEANITRAEVATIFFRMLNEATRNQYLARTNSFSDVKPTVWYSTAVSTMANMGVIGGYPDGTYRPKENITRAEFIALAAHFDPDGDTTPSSFTDIDDHWAKDEINIAANNGWTLGNGTGLFEPDELITRAEAMALVNRVLQRIPESPADLLSGMITWPDNMDTSKWYYLAIQEAGNSHNYVRKENGYEYWTQFTQAPNWKQFE